MLKLHARTQIVHKKQSLSDECGKGLRTKCLLERSARVSRTWKYIFEVVIFVIVKVDRCDFDTIFKSLRNETLIEGVIR